LASRPTTAASIAVRTSRGGGTILGSLDDVRIRSTIYEGSTAVGLYPGGNGSTLTKGPGEIVLGDVVNLLDARSTKVDAVGGAVLDGDDSGNDLVELVDRQRATIGVKFGESLGDAKLVAVRSIGKANGLSDRGVNLLYERGEGTGCRIAEHKIRGAAGANVGDDEGKVFIGARATRAKTL